MSNAGLAERLRGIHLFAEMAPGNLARLVESAEVREFEPHSRVLQEGDPSREFFVLLDGVAGVFYSSTSGVDLLVKIFAAPAAFGEMELFFRQPRQEYVQAFERATVAIFPGDIFLDVMRHDAAACFVMLQDVSVRLCIAAYHERALAFLETPVRLAGLLLSFLDVYGRPTPSGIALKYAVTYEMLARCLGVTTRSIDRAMTSWMREEWLMRRGGIYTFRSREELEARADPERLTLFSTLRVMPR